LICETDNVDPDAVGVEALARLALAAKRHNCQIQLKGARPELRELVAFMGLDSVLPG
jgi:anti-anti-sigma regulatory factor